MHHCTVGVWECSWPHPLLLQGYPYTSERLLAEARIDICPLYRGEIWACVLGVKVWVGVGNEVVYVCVGVKVWVGVGVGSEGLCGWVWVLGVKVGGCGCGWVLQSTKPLRLHVREMCRGCTTRLTRTRRTPVTAR